MSGLINIPRVFQVYKKTDQLESTIDQSERSNILPVKQNGGTNLRDHPRIGLQHIRFIGYFERYFEFMR